MFNQILFLFAIIIAAISVISLFSAIIYLSILDGWRGFMFYTLPARTLNYMAGNKFNAKLQLNKLDRWNGKDVNEIFDNKKTGIKIK